MSNSEKSDDQSNSGFWSSLTGVLTAIAGVIGAVTALLLGLKEVGLIGQNPAPATAPTPTPTITASPVTPLPTPSPVSPAPVATPTPTISASPSVSTPDPPKSIWEFMGVASTGEGISVNRNSIDKSASSVDFEYKIGDELISASADCKSNRWYAEGYGWYSPQSEATQKMLNFVCGL